METWGNGFDNIREGSSEKVTFEKIPKWSERMSQGKVWGRGFVAEGPASATP